MQSDKPPATYTVEETAKLLRVGRNKAYEGVKAGEIPSIKIGKRILVPRVALEQMLAKSNNAVR
jgi:excisionase family DNA binding protein